MDDNRSLISKITSIFNPPVFHDDEEKTQLTRVLYYTTIVTLLVSVFTHFMVSSVPDTLFLSQFASLLRVIGSIVILFLLRRGKQKLSAYLFISILWIAFAFSTPYNGGVYSFGFRSGFLLLIFVTSLLLGFRESIVVSLLSIVYGLILAIYFPSTDFLTKTYYNNPIRFWSINAVLFLVSIIFIRYSISTIRESLSKARKELKERLKTEKFFQESKQNYFEVFNATSEAIFIQDPETGNILDANESAVRMYGYNSKEEITTLGIVDLSLNESGFTQVEANEFLKEAIGGKVKVFEWYARKKNGDLFWTEVSLRASQIGGKNRILAVVRDNTDKRKAEESLRENEQRLRMLSESAFEGIAITENGIVIETNDQLAAMLEYTREEIIGKSVSNFVAPQSSDYVHQMINIGKEEPYEHLALSKNWREFWVEVRGKSSTIGSRKVRVTVMRDIDLQKRQSVIINRTHQQLRNIIRSASRSSFISTDLSGNITAFSPGAELMLGFSADEMIGKQTPACFHLATEMESRGKELSAMYGYSVTGFEIFIHKAKVGEYEEREWTYVRKDGSHLFVSLVVTPVYDDQGVMTGFLGVARDITEQKAATEKFLIAFNNAPLLMTISTYDDGRFLEVNNQCFNYTGYQPEEIIGKTATELQWLPNESRAGILEMLDKNGHVVDLDLDLRKKDGTIIHRLYNCEIILINGKKCLISISLNITDRKIAEQTIHENEDKFSKIFYDAPVIMSISDIETGEFIEVNDSGVKLSGFTREEIIGKSSTELGWITAHDRHRILELLQKEGEVRSLELALHKKNGELLHCWFSGHIISVNGIKRLLSISQDISEQKLSEERHRKLEEQLLHAQKMEAFGRLAGGIAHDFNNMLTPILGFGEILRKSFSENDPRANKLNQIIHAAESSKNLVAKLLAFARKQNLEMKRIDLNSVVLDFQKILSRTLRENIIIKTHYDDADVIIHGDAGQIEQIILNLSVNAMHAMPNGGTLIIETKNISITDKIIFGEEEKEMELGEYVLLSMSDTGSGIPKEILPKIYDPFFTTKEKGKGTGLGLSTVYGIVKQHHGYISVYSEVGIGTTFKIYFPHYSGKEDEQVKSRRSNGEFQSKKQTILVVEDQEQILELIQEVLTDEGYTIFTASSVTDALKIFRAHRNDINRLITDIILPDGNGRQLFETILAEKPSIKVMFMSSYTEDIISNNNYLPENSLFIPKPFTLTAFNDAVQILNEG